MVTEIVTTTSALTTAVKNAHDITTGLINTRKQNRLISTGQLNRLNISIQEAIVADRMKGMHTLETYGRNCLMDSYHQIEEHLNTPLGDMLLETIRDELRFYESCLIDFERSTRNGGGFR